MLRSKLLCAGLSTALFASVCAAESRYGFGIEAGFFHSKQEVDFNLNGNSYTFDDDKNIGNVGLKTLYVFTPNHRIYSSYSFNPNNNIKSSRVIPMLGTSGAIDVAVQTFNIRSHQHRILLGYDFTPQISEQTRAVLGIYGGYSRAITKILEPRAVFTNVTPGTGVGSGQFLGERKWKRNFDGFVYGAKLGMISELDENNEIEFGLKVENSDFSEKSITLSGSDIPLKPSYLNYGIYIAYNYKF